VGLAMKGRSRYKSRLAGHLAWLLPGARPMSVRRLFVAAAIGLAVTPLGCGPSKAEGPGAAIDLGTDAPVPAVANPTPAPADSLGDWVGFDGYRVRPPRAYHLASRRPLAKGSGTVTTWAGRPRSDTTSPQFTITVETRLATSPPTLEDLLTTVVHDERRRHTNWTQSIVEPLTLQGLAVRKVIWSGHDPFTARKVGGALFAAIDGQTTITMSGRDAEPGVADAVRSAEEAAATFSRDEGKSATPLPPPMALAAEPFDPLPRPCDRILGGIGPETVFVDTTPAGGWLVGLDIGQQEFGASNVIGAIRPIYRVGANEIAGPLFGTEAQPMVRALANPGYAIGAIHVRARIRVNAVAVTFMRVNGERLNPADAYSTVWIGGPGGGEPITLTGNGTPVIGIRGKANKELTGLGLLFRDSRR